MGEKMIAVSQSNKVKYFKVRSSKGEGWADFVISFDEKSARNLNISVISDYGNFACTLAAPKEDYFSFLKSMQKDSIMERLFEQKYYIYSSEKMKSEILEAINEYYAENEELHKNQKDEEIEDLTNEMVIHNYHVCQHILYEHESFQKFFGEYDNLPNGKVINNAVDDFWENCWVPLVKHMNENHE